MEARSEFLAACAGMYDAFDPLTTATLTFMELAEQALQAGLKMGRMLLKDRLEGDSRANPAEAPACTGCQKSLRIQDPAQQRTLQTMLGEVEYRRAYCVCDRCGATRVPLDEGLGIPATGPSIDALHKICHASVATRSFEGGSRVLKVQAGLEVPRKRIRHWAEKEGKNLVENRAEDVQRYQAGKSPDSTEIPALLVITADGGRVQTRQPTKDDRWKENKIGVIYDALVQPGGSATGDYEGAKAQTKTFVATMEPWEKMGWMLRVEAEKRGYARARERLFLGDGATGVRAVKDLQFPETIFILDWAHATEHLNQSGKAAFGEGTQKARRWYERYEDHLWEGHLDTIIKELDRLSRELGPPRPDDNEFSPRKILDRNAHSYFPNNKEAMNYPLFRSKGWPIGSGVVEGAVKQFALRLKGSEKFWNVSNTGAEEMLALCALYLSEDGRWERHWRDRAQPYQRK